MPNPRYLHETDEPDAFGNSDQLRNFELTTMAPGFFPGELVELRKARARSSPTPVTVSAQPFSYPSTATSTVCMYPRTSFTSFTSPISPASQSFNVNTPVFPIGFNATEQPFQDMPSWAHVNENYHSKVSNNRVLQHNLQPDFCREPFAHLAGVIDASFDDHSEHVEFVRFDNGPFKQEGQLFDIYSSGGLTDGKAEYELESDNVSSLPTLTPITPKNKISVKNKKESSIKSEEKISPVMKKIHEAQKELSPRKGKGPKADAKKRTRDAATDLYFSSYEAICALNDGVAWSAFVPEEGPDESIPATKTAMVEWIRSLVNAILNNKGCKEQSSSKSFQNRWGDNSDYYHPADILKLARALLKKGIRIHTEGWKDPIYDSQLEWHIACTKKFTFKERMELVIQLLTHSKRTCEELMKGEKLNQVIGAPHLLNSRTSSNMESNKRKAARIAFATAHEKGAAKANSETLLMREVPKSKKRAANDVADDGSSKRTRK